MLLLPCWIKSYKNSQMKHTDFYTFQQEFIGQISIIFMHVTMKSKSWAFWDISEMSVHLQKADVRVKSL